MRDGVSGNRRGRAQRSTLGARASWGLWQSELHSRHGGDDRVHGKENAVSIATWLLSGLLLQFPIQSPSVRVHIPTSDAIKVAATIARSEGYDIRDDRTYFFDSLDSGSGRPAKEVAGRSNA